MFENILESKAKSILELLNKELIKDNFYLAGGTALALQFNHRKSIDLDFFCFKDFSTSQLKNRLNKFSKFEIISEDKGTLHVVLNQVKISFLHYPYSLLFKTHKLKGIKIADWQDIACMKISAISGRGSKKDFVDLYFVLEKISLNKLLRLFDKKYKHIKYSQTHILKSLTYFSDADKEPMPKMLKKINWSEIKREIQNMVKNYLKI